MLVRINIFSLTLLKSIIKGLPLRNPPFFNIGDISFGEMIRRKVIRREKGNLTSFHPLFFIFISSLFSVSIHPVSRLSKELMEGWRCPPRWGSKINALPSKFYEVEKRDAASFVTRVPPPFLSFFFFRKKSATKKILFDAVFPFFFFFLWFKYHISLSICNRTTIFHAVACPRSPNKWNRV